MELEEKLNILVCPLGWGLGHASRDIPIIERLINMGHTVSIAGDKFQIDYLQRYFPSINAIHFPSLKARYSRSSSQFFPLLWVALRLPFFNIFEHFLLIRLIRKNGFNLVISDNRYGLWSRQIKTVIITHQLRVIPPSPFKWTLPVIEFMLKRWLGRFNNVVVPDYNDDRSISGLLSKPNGLENLHYIGPLSRFEDINIDVDFKGFELVVVVSGPEPQRTIFVDIAENLAVKWRLNCLIIEGNPENGVIPRVINGVWHVGHLPDLQFALAVKHAKYLVLRGGYSTVMDMLTLGISGLLVPTPGQTEQEYLAKYLSERNIFRFVTQKDLSVVDIELMRAKKIDTVWRDKDSFDFFDNLI
ncbi:MAG: glycosyltransferase [Bacteroidales bacterium]